MSNHKSAIISRISAEWCRVSILSLCAAFAAFAAVAPAAAAQPAFAILHSFAGSDGAYPNAGLLAGPGGVLYGTTTGGGASSPGSPAGGVAFRLAPTATGWTETVLHRFGASLADGGNPHSNLVADPQGALYGTTAQGGPRDAGTVYRLTPPAVAGATWGETVLYSFAGGTDGAVPVAGVVRDRAGCLYGTASQGGAADLGTVYRLCPPPSRHGAWVFRTLHTFTGADGAAPAADLIARTLNGVYTLFGTTSSGGASGWGTVFALGAPGPGPGATLDLPWHHSVLHAFSGGKDGAAPIGALSADGGLHLYGTTTRGGASPASSGAMGGVVFKLSPPVAGQAGWSELVLHSFIGGSDGLYPLGGVVEASNAHLFGTSAGEGYGGCHSQCGTVYELAPRNPGGTVGPWSEHIVHSFSGRDGDVPSANLVPVIDQSHSVSFYGPTERGGASNLGALFKIIP